MWVHPDLVKDQQWTVGSNMKAKGKAKASSCNVIGFSITQGETDTTSLSDSGEEEFVYNAASEKPLAGTRSGKIFSKEYDEAPASSSKPVEKTTEPKKKELRFSKPLQKNGEEGSPGPFRFNVMAQLANIPARITLHELLRLSKPTRDALQEALADAEAFSIHFPISKENKEDKQCPRCCLTSEEMLAITFTPDDMQIKGKHN
jgi:hypothetical protein